MNTELTHTWVNKVLGTFSFRRLHLVWDPYGYHIEDCVISSLHAKNIDVAFVSFGYTKYILSLIYIPSRTVVNWILKAWKEITAEIIEKSFNTCV